MLRKLRAVDLSLGLSGLSYGVAGSWVAILGSRALQIIFLPTVYTLRSLTAVRRARKVLFAYFLLVLAVFPLGMLHIFYDDSYYMTMRDQHAADVIFGTMYESGREVNFRIMLRSLMYGYLSSKPHWKGATYVGEKNPIQLISFDFIFMSPELEKGWIAKGGLTENQVSDFEGTALRLSRVYSNGHVTILRNPYLTPGPEV